MSFKKGFFNNLLVSGGYNYLSQAIAFFSTVITSRLLPPESFGFIGLITVFTGFVSIFSDSGISLAVIRSDFQGTYHRAMDSLAFILGISLSLITCLLAYPISLFYHNHELLWPTMAMSLIFIFRSLSLVRGALLSKALKFAIIGRITLVSACTQVLLNIVLAYCGWGYWSLIIPQIVSNLVTIALYERAVGMGFKSSSLPMVKVAYRHTRKTIGNLMGFNMVNYWARNLDNLVVGRLFGVTELGIYNRAYSLLAMPLTMITGLIGNILFPSFKKLKSEGGNLKEEYLFILKMILAATLPVSAILILLPERFVLLLWGQRWMAVSSLLPYFGLLVFSQSLISTTGNMLVLLEKERVMRLSGWIGAAAMIAGIAYGAGISIQAIAQFYSLAFIGFVLPFNVIYLFIKHFGFGWKETALFWLPLVIISLSIWLACYFRWPYFKTGSVLALFLFVALQAKPHLVPGIYSFLGRKRLLLTKADS